jgi:peptidoglycan glycosyltransferase
MGVATPATRFTYQLYPPDRTHGGWWHQSETRILCQNHPTNASPFDLSEAYQWSCNIAFADLGLRIGAAAYEELAGRFGLGRAIPLDLPSVASQLYHTPGYLTGPERVYALGSTAFGQGELAVTPLQMALIAAGIANAGKIPRPHVVARVQTAEGSVLDTVIPSIWQTAVDPQTAAIVRSMMVASVEKGWARSAAIKGVSVAGKTGTAETGGKETPHSWFIGFAPADDPRIAIAVVKEYAGFGSEQAAPIARRLMAAFLGV